MGEGEQEMSRGVEGVCERGQDRTGGQTRHTFSVLRFFL